MYLTISTSLNPTSRSRLMAEFAHAQIEKALQADGGGECRLIDLAETPLPMCDGDSAYMDPAVPELSAAISGARGILIASPIYNYDVSASAKNMIELTGKAWTEKVVGFLCAAGGQGSYMAPMQMANSLMLDFRSLVLPGFVYATGDMFQGDEISESQIEDRITKLADQMIKVAAAVN